MLRLHASRSRLLVGAIGPQHTSYVLTRPRTLLNRRFLTDKRSLSSPKTRNENPKTMLKDATPPVLPGGASSAAPGTPPKLVQSVDAPGSSVSPKNGTAPTQVPLVPPTPGATSLPPKPDPSLELESPLESQSPLPGVPREIDSSRLPLSTSDPWPTVLVGVEPKTDPAPLAPSIPPQSTSITPKPSNVLVPLPRGTIHPPPSPPPPQPTSLPPPKKKRRLRRFFLLLTLLTGSSFAGGVYYSLRSDNFHDFFTEYVPFGEEAVLYFEEKEFRRRFPNALSRVLHKRAEAKVTIPKRSGATWRILETEDKPNFTELNKEGPHTKSIGKGGPNLNKPEQAQDTSLNINSKETQAVVIPRDPVQPKVIDEKPLPPPKASQQVEAAKQATGTDTPTPTPPSSRTLALIEIQKDSDPIVGDLVQIINSMIELANTSNLGNIFEPVVFSAKAELSSLGNKITKIREAGQKVTAQKLQEQELEFAKTAQGILTRVDREAESINERYAEQLEHIRDEIAEAYGEKLHSELEKTTQVFEQRTKNELLEQAIEMKRRWIAEIKNRVEEERNGRLGNLKELSMSVNELEKLVGSWADVVESNLRTQRIHVAVEAVKNVVEDPAQPKPFIRELAALKEVAEADEVVRAAIASINPRAYQKGISSPAQLIDRFRRVSEEVRKAALLPENAGVASHAASFVLSKILFKKSGLTTGSDVESILTRTETYLEEGDLDNAAREMNQLQGWAKVLATDWLREVRLLLEVQQAVEVIGIQARLQSLRSSA